MDKGEYEKTGEFLWGALAAYINAIVFLRTGEAKYNHSKLVTAGKNIPKVVKDPDLLKAVRQT